MFVITAAGHQLSLHCTSQLSLLSTPGQDTPPLLQSILSTMITTLALSVDGDTGVRTGGSDISNKKIYLSNLSTLMYLFYHIFNKHINLTLHWSNIWYNYVFAFVTLAILYLALQSAAIWRRIAASNKKLCKKYLCGVRCVMCNVTCYVWRPRVQARVRDAAAAPALTMGGVGCGVSVSCPMF